MQGNRSRKHIWHQVPLFRLIWPLIGGIILGIFFPNFYVAALTASIGLISILILIIFGVRRNVGLVTMTVFVIVGYGLTILNTDRLFPNHYSSKELSKQVLFAELTSDAIPRIKSTKAEVRLISAFDGESYEQIQGKLLVYFEKDSQSLDLGVNDTVVLKGWISQISEPKNPNEFNYKRYMGFHQITHQVYVSSKNWCLVGSGIGFFRWIKDVQHSVLAILADKGLDRDELAIVSALLVGYKHYLSADQVNAFASTGAMHVLAVSGLHVGIVYLILSRLFKPFHRFRNGKIVTGLTILVMLWIYAGITGFSPSVTRATTMFSFVIGAQLMRRNTDIFNTLATSAMLLLVINPFLIVEVGFQLSYLAVIGIVVLQPRIYDLWQPNNWLLDKIWAITAVSIAAQTATFPLGLLYFHQFPTYFLVSNLIVIPAATIILPIGILLVSVHWIPLISNVIGFTLERIVHWLNLIIGKIQELPYSLVSGVDITIFETYFIYMIIVTSVAFLITKRYSWLMSFLIAICAIQVLNIGELVSQKNQAKLIVYSVKGHNAIDVIDGLNHNFYADSMLQNDFDKMRFHIHHNWWYLGLKDPTIRPFSAGLFNFEHLVMYVLDGKHRYDMPDQVDVLLVAERTVQHPIEVLRSTEPGLVLLSENLDWKSHRYWSKLLQEKGIEYWDMKTQGAYIRNIEV